LDIINIKIIRSSVMSGKKKTLEVSASKKLKKLSTFELSDFQP